MAIFFLIAGMILLLGVGVMMLARRELAFGANAPQNLQPWRLGLEIAFWLGIAFCVMSWVADADRPRPVAKPPEQLTIPRNVQDVVENAIVTGVVSADEASIINEWLNVAVRPQRREFHKAVVEYEAGFPRELLGKIRDGATLSIEERTKILQWAMTSDTIAADEIHEAVLKALYGEKIDETERAAVGVWLAQGPSIARESLPLGWKEPSLWDPNEAPRPIEAPPAPGAGEVAPMPPAP